MQPSGPSTEYNQSIEQQKEHLRRQRRAYNQIHERQVRAVQPQDDTELYPPSPLDLSSPLDLPLPLDLPSPLDLDAVNRDMDQFALGDRALSSKDFASAITHYTEAIEINPTAVKYYISRATAYTRLSPPNHASSLKDSEIAVSLAIKRSTKELIIESQMRRVIALFGLERYGDSKQCLEWVKQKINTDDKKNNTAKTVPIWEMKINKKLKDLDEGDEKANTTVKENPEVDLRAKEKPVEKAKSDEKTEGLRAATPPAQNSSSASTSAAPAPTTGVQTPASKIRHEWYQNNEAVIVTLYCKGIDKGKATVEIKDQSLDIAFPLPTGSDYNLSLDPLLFLIDRMKSSYKIMSTKAEFTLVKSTPGQKWASLEGTEAVDVEDNDASSADATQQAAKRASLAPKTNNAGPSYPTSSKSGPKDWDKVVNDLSQKPKKENKDGGDDDTDLGGLDDDDGGDPAMGFFKTLYKGADEDTKRAMMKSYQESNGTALSTNWSEVGKGKVETSPPDGMEAKKWD